MNIRKVLLIVTVFCLSLPFTIEAQDQQSYSLQLLQPSKLEIKGKSSLHPFTVTASTIGVTGSVSMNGGLKVEDLQEGRIEELQILIPVASLKSDKQELDKNLRQDLKASAFPEISFQLVEQQIGELTSEAFPIRLNGKLTVAGVQKPIAVEAQITKSDAGLHVVGSTSLLMTEFGIKPRKFMFVMKVENQIDIHFDLTVALQEQIARLKGE